MTGIRITKVTFEHASDRGAVPTATPRISWRFDGQARDWLQTSYDVRIQRTDGVEDYHVDSSKSNLVPWPSTPLASREKAIVSVKANGTIDTEWYTTSLETTLLRRDDWTGQMISNGSSDLPFRLSREFKVDKLDHPIRLYATAFGLYDIEINGKTVGTQVLKPGWTSYDYRLYFQSYDVSDLIRVGVNTITGHIAEGWYSGRLGFLGGKRNLYGDCNGLMAQVMMGERTLVQTDDEWKWARSHLQSSEIYDGEVCDMRLLDTQSQWQPVKILDSPTSELIPDMSPVRRMEEVCAEELLVTPSGKRIVAFGQNLVGWVRINRTGDHSSGDKIILTHAEVLENGELGTRPLRVAKCQDTIILGHNPLTNWEPTFTFHGFRYVQVEGWSGEMSLSDLTAVVVHTDMERTGWFESSHPMINRLHENVLWGMKGNFVGLPTDCPQRDERLGWTGDLQVFTKTASFLYDTTSMLSGWLQDLAVEQADNQGVPPLVVPDILKKIYPGKPQPNAVWGDVAVLSPIDLYEASGDSTLVLRQYDSMFSWLKAIPRDEDGLSSASPDAMQLGDWLDPAAPPDFPGDGRTDPYLVANAYLVHVTRKMAEVARLINKEEDAERFDQEWRELRRRYSEQYVSKAGRTVSDSQTALALSLHFDLLSPSQRPVATARLETLVKQNVFKVATGFAGTPLILDVLADNDRLQLAYRMLQEKQCPSWLYCVSMGATTIWERWDSMRPDGSINPGEMTSFNHYALGAVANFMHRVIGGISPLEPGWKRFYIAPRPGGTVTSATVKHLCPHGLITCSWQLCNGTLTVDAQVPPNTTAVVDLGSLMVVGSGDHHWTIPYQAPEWPPKPIYHSMTIPLIDEIA